MAPLLTRFCSTLLVLLPAGGLRGQTVAELAAKAEALGFRTAVAVCDLDSGTSLYRHRAEEFLIPASNQKLLVAAATLWGLGSRFEFRTVFRLRQGWLEVHAAGDPNWLAGSAHDPAEIFRRVAATLREAKVTRIRGVRLDPGLFNGPVRPEGWPRNQFDRTYCAPTGGLVLQAGCFTARISPGKGEAQVELIAPPVRVPVGGRIQMTTRSKKRYSYWISQSKEAFTGHGEFGARSDPVEVTGVAQDPEWLFRVALENVLRREEIATSVDAPAADLDVMSWTSDLPLALREMLVESSNFHAEQLLRVLGAQTLQKGNFEGGCAAVRAALGAKLDLPEGLRIVDGSGLSRGNRVSPAFLVQVLRVLVGSDDGKLVLDCLPQGGVSGTLKRRFRKAGQAEAGRATRAKTGYINGVRSLSGVVVTAAGETRVFSILLNRRRGTSTRGAAGIQDAMVTALYRGRVGG